MAKRRFRTVWISDVHLGTLQCKAEALDSFLKSFKCEVLYLVGDIIDGWYIKANGWYWPSSHNNVVRQFLKKAEKQNTRVWYITGNHDEFLRDFVGEHTLTLGNIEIVNDRIHFSLEGKKLWVVHGDHYDVVLKHYRTIEVVGDFIYKVITWIDRKYDILRRKFKLPKASLVRFLKENIHLMNKFTKRFEEAVAYEAQKRGFDGVVCGHIHRATSKFIEGTEYWNCGDWVDSCTAVVEDFDGKLSVVEWVEKDNGDFGLQPLYAEDV